jgi:hypothetical protein
MGQASVKADCEVADFVKAAWQRPHAITMSVMARI